jgi:hypothetical protein
MKGGGMNLPGLLEMKNLRIVLDDEVARWESGHNPTRDELHDRP